MVWTTVDDVIGSWIGDDAPTDTALVDLWIGKAEREVRRRIPDLQTRIDAEAELEPPSTELLESTKDVVVAMVSRVFRNPEGVRTIQKNSTTGPFTSGDSITMGGDQPGTLWLTDDEIAKLRGEVTAGAAFMVDTLPPDAGSAYPLVWESWA